MTNGLDEPSPRFNEARGQKAKAADWRKKLPVTKPLKPAETKKD